MIETARLHLRPPEPSDTPSLTALMTPAVSQWLGRWPSPFTPEMAEARIAEAVAANAAGEGLRLVVQYRGNFAGWIAGGITHGHSAEFGYWLGEAYQGQGLMLEAAPAFVDAIQARLGLASIDATCHPENRASSRVLEACGLCRTGARFEFAAARSRDEWVDIWERTWPDASVDTVNRGISPGLNA